jgi:hypothetical protein
MCSHVRTRHPPHAQTLVFCVSADTRACHAAPPKRVACTWVLCIGEDCTRALHARTCAHAAPPVRVCHSAAATLQRCLPTRVRHCCRGHVFERAAAAHPGAGWQPGHTHTRALFHSAACTGAKRRLVGERSGRLRVAGRDARALLGSVPWPHRTLLRTAISDHAPRGGGARQTHRSGACCR